MLGITALSWVNYSSHDPFRKVMCSKCLKHGRMLLGSMMGHWGNGWEGSFSGMPNTSSRKIRWEGESFWSWIRNPPPFGLFHFSASFQRRETSESSLYASWRKYWHLMKEEQKILHSTEAQCSNAIAIGEIKPLFYCTSLAGSKLARAIGLRISSIRGSNKRRYWWFLLP